MLSFVLCFFSLPLILSLIEIRRHFKSRPREIYYGASGGGGQHCLVCGGPWECGVACSKNGGGGGGSGGCGDDVDNAASKNESTTNGEVQSRFPDEARLGKVEVEGNGGTAVGNVIGVLGNVNNAAIGASSKNHSGVTGNCQSTGSARQNESGMNMTPMVDGRRGQTGDDGALTLNSSATAVTATADEDNAADANAGQERTTRYEPVPPLKTVPGNGSAALRHLRHYASQDSDANDDQSSGLNDARGPEYPASKR